MIQGKPSKSKVGHFFGLKLGGVKSHPLHRRVSIIDSNSISYQSLLDIYIYNIYILTINVWKLLVFSILFLQSSTKMVLF